MVRIASIKHSNIRALTSFASLSLALLLAVVPVAASAEKADRDKPMNIEADNLLHDELKQVSIFTGHVVLTKGTMIMRGDRIEIRTDADGYQFGVILPEANKRAFFRQKPRGGFAEAVGDEIVEKSVWLGKYIPIIRVPGEEIVLESIATPPASAVSDAGTVKGIVMSTGRRARSSAACAASAFTYCRTVSTGRPPCTIIFAKRSSSRRASSGSGAFARKASQS